MLIERYPVIKNEYAVFSRKFDELLASSDAGPPQEDLLRLISSAKRVRPILIFLIRHLICITAYH